MERLDLPVVGHTEKERLERERVDNEILGDREG